MAYIFNPSSRYKLVYLDEFERASAEYQDSLKGFINDNSDNIRFIFVTNHIHKIEGGLRSRCTEINFDPLDEKEILWWKTNAKNRLIDIAEKEEIKISETDIKKIVAYNYPDIRKMIVVLSEVKKTGKIQYSTTTFSNELKSKLYKALTSGNILDIQSFVLGEFGQENIQSLFNLCGRPLLEMMIRKNPSIVKTEKLGDIYYVVSEHSMMLNTIKGGDPVVVGTSCLNKIKNIIL
jgi:DNA polymerase III delta prime subunit